MEDLQIINEIVNDSVKESSYTAVIISSTVFIVYTLIVRLIDYFKSKDKDKPLMEMSKAVKEVSSNVVKLNSVLDKMIQDNSKKDFTKCKTTIELSFISFKSNIEESVRDIILKNNVEKNADLIKQNILQKVNTEYYKIISNLSIYEVNDISVSNYLKEKWIEEITTNIINIVYTDQSKEDRISQLSNRLRIIIDGYVTYINNKLL